MNTALEPTYFSTPPHFRKWLQENHGNATKLLVGFYKVGSDKPSMTWPQSVDEALCFGWIDGVRKSIDKDSYCIRFTPRKSSSIWSAVNIKKIEELTQKGLMQPAGMASFASRKEDKSRIYAYEQKQVKLSDDFEQKFKTNEKAWKFFQSLSPSYLKVSINWVMSAKQEATQLRRLQELINDSEAQKNKWRDYK